MIKLNKIDWTKLLHLFAEVGVHKMMNFHFSEHMRQLPRPGKLRVRNDVYNFLENEEYDPQEFQELYPIMLILFNKNRPEYSNVIRDIPALMDRHSQCLSTTNTVIRGHLKILHDVCQALHINVPRKYNNDTIKEIKQEYEVLIKTLMVA